MNFIRNFIVTLGVMGGVALTATGYAWWQYTRCVVILENRSGHHITQAKIAVNGNAYDVGTLNENQTVHVQVHPRGESGVKLWSHTGRARGTFPYARGAESCLAPSAVLGTR